MSLKEKIANADSTNWLKDGMTDEEINQTITKAKEDAKERLSLESAIKHCDEVAEEKEGMCEYNLNCSHFQYVEWKKCADEHRQLAKWLRKLKAYEEGCKCETCKYKDADSVSRPCMDCGDNESKWEYGGAE